MKRETLDEFFESMKTAKTYGWDALVVYDRGRANQLLLQEYIDRFDEGRYFPPLNFVTDTTPGVRWEITYDYLLDKPRLSFENSDISSSRADLKMRIVGGKQVSVMRQQGTKYYQVTRLKHADALNGAVLHARISLDVAPGSVGEVGRAVLDLSHKDLKFYLTVGDSEEENEAGGLRFKREFDKWPDEDKVFRLNTLVVNEQDFLQPESFFMRTHPAPDSAIMNAPSHGDGEIILFVRMRGSSNGDFPPTNEDLHYLLPTSAFGPCTVNIIIGRNLLFLKLMESALARVADLVVPELAMLEGPAVGARLVKGSKRLTGVELGDHGAVSNLVLQTDMVLAGRNDQQRDAVFQFKAGGELDGMEVTVAGSQVFDVKFDLSGDARSASINCEWELIFEADPRYRANDEGRFQLFFVSNIKPLVFKSAVLTEGLDKGVINNLVSATSRYFTGLFTEIAEQLAPRADAVNVLQLHRILFGNASSWILPTDPKLPADLIQPGFLAPTRTDYQISDTELVMGAGRQHTFSLSEGVQARWSVENLPGEDGYPGCIDPETGVYKAPEAADLPLKHKRVIVTATTALHVSKALVSVVTRSIGFDPVVMAVADDQSSNKITASALGEATITWAVAPGFKGQLIDDPQGNPDAQYAKLYISPAGRNSLSEVGQGRNVAPAARKSEAWLERSSAGAESEDDEIEQVLWVDTIVGTLDDGTSETLNVLVPMELVTNWFTFEPQGDGIQLKFWARGKSGDYEVAPEDTKWYRVKGTGSFVNGLYTPSSAGAGDYAVLAAIETDERNWYWTYAILPLPYLPVDELIERSEEVAP